MHRCAWWWQRNPGEPGLPLVSSGLATLDAEFRRPYVGSAGLQAAGRLGDDDHQHQPINPLRATQPTVAHVKDAGFLIAEQLLTAEAPAGAPDHTQVELSTVDLVPGLLGLMLLYCFKQFYDDKPI